MTGLTFYGHDVEANHLVVTHTDVHLPRWPPAANGLRIGQISDFHGDYPDAITRTERAVAMLLSENTDMIFVTGDYVTGWRQSAFLPQVIASLAPLAAKSGRAFAILGNHDWWSHLQDEATVLLSAAGFQVLRNASAPFPGVPGAFIVGMDDPWARAMDVDKALAGVPPDAPKLLLMHEPDFADSVGPGFDLQLSGHSHGGQVKIPGYGGFHYPQYGERYPEGLRQASRHLVYTNRGIGMVGPQVRLFCPPEVTVLTIRS